MKIIWKLLMVFVILSILTSCKKEASLIGKWVSKNDKTVYMEFSEDGYFFIRDAKTNKNVLKNTIKYKLINKNGNMKIKYDLISKGNAADSRYEEFKIENDVLKLKTKAYSNRGEKSYFENYYRKK